MVRQGQYLSSFEIQKTLYNRLRGNLSCNVFDQVPEDQPKPYVKIGESTSIDWGTKTFYGEEATETIHVFSNYSGFKECKDIMSEILFHLTKSKLTANNFSISDIRTDFLQIFNDDEFTKHGILRLRMLIKQN